MSLVFYFSSMNSGKSLSLLTKNFMLREKGANTILIKPSIDDRTHTISSRLGIEEECLVVDPLTNIVSMIRSNVSYSDIMPDYVLVDEAQFLTKEQVWQLSELVDHFDIAVLCYGIKLNWQGQFFEGSEELIKIADKIVQFDTYCKETGEPALFHIKKGGNGDSVETGYEDMYETVSRKVWRQWYNERSR